MTRRNSIAMEEGGNLAANCNQIFTKGPNRFTKDLVNKVKKRELANNRTFICGQEFTRRHIWMLAGLLILFSTNFLGAILFWGTNYFDTVVLDNLVLRNGSDAFASFTKPAVGPYYRIHIFNYTNVDAFEKRIADKLRVEDVGPYVFQEHIERVNIRFNDDYTISFQEKRSYNFVPELSEGRRQSDQFFVPNLPLLGSVAMVKDTYFMTRVGLASVLKGLNSKAFLKLSADRFIWGYDDSFFSLVKSILAFQKELPFEKFGLLATKTGISKDVITVFTGADNIEKIGKIARMNGEDKMTHWSTDECNSIDGTLGSFFSPFVVRDKKPIHIYTKDICRKLNFDFKKDVTLLETFQAYRYTLNTRTFAHPDVEPRNQCFCDVETGVCPPHGILNSTPCAYGPAYLSLPHFLDGDRSLTQNIEGLYPNPEIHTSFLDVHPIFGYTMDGWTKLQLNMQVKRVYGISQVDMFEDDTMLPIAWFDSGINPEDLPKHVYDIFYKTSFTVIYIELFLKYTCLLMTFVTFVTMAIIIQGRLRSKRPIRTMGGMPAPFQRNISGLDALIN